MTMSLNIKKDKCIDMIVRLAELRTYLFNPFNGDAGSQTHFFFVFFFGEIWQLRKEIDFAIV